MFRLFVPESAVIRGNFQDLPQAVPPRCIPLTRILAQGLQKDELKVTLQSRDQLRRRNDLAFGLDDVLHSMSIAIELDSETLLSVAKKHRAKRVDICCCGDWSATGLLGARHIPV